MTTIAYNAKDGEIAADGRVTRGQTIVCDDYDKSKLNEHGLFLLAGSVGAVNKLIMEYPIQDASFDYSFVTGFLVKNGKVNWVGGGDGFYSVCEITGVSESCGSGQDHALTAMDFGLSAKKAVKMAAKRDCATGGKVRVFKVSDY